MIIVINKISFGLILQLLILFSLEYSKYISGYVGKFSLIQRPKFDFMGIRG